MSDVAFQLLTDWKARVSQHANVDTTLNVYTQVLDGSVREAVQNVGDQMFTIVHRPAAIDAGGTLIS